MTDRSIAHGSFTVTRTYPAAVARVWRAWADPAAKGRWFPSGGALDFDFRVGGRESNISAFGGNTYAYNALYQDIVEHQRIIYTYEMTMNGERISVSLATIEFTATGEGTRLTVVEYGAFLDGLDTIAQREEGTNALMDALGRTLAD